MKKTVTVIDYGLCNLFSVKHALEKLGAQVEITSDTQRVLNAERLILPGVGAFGKAMEKIKALNLDGPIKEAAAKGTPLLGICLGMQLLATKGLEFGDHEGLDLIPGVVKPISSVFPPDFPDLILPHISWQRLKLASHFDERICKKLQDEHFYFVHSFFFETVLESNRIATFDFMGVDLTAVVANKNVIGFQFHPERSSRSGLDLLEAFLTLR